MISIKSKELFKFREKYYEIRSNVYNYIKIQIFCELNIWLKVYIHVKHEIWYVFHKLIEYNKIFKHLFNFLKIIKKIANEIKIGINIRNDQESIPNKTTNNLERIQFASFPLPPSTSCSNLDEMAHFYGAISSFHFSPTIPTQRQVGFSFTIVASHPPHFQKFTSKWPKDITKNKKQKKK